MAKILVEIVGDAKHFKSALGSAGRDAEKFGGKVRGHASGALKGLGIAAGGAALVGVGLLAKGMMDGVKTAVEHEKALAQTNAVIKSTGSSANVNAAHILKLSDSIEKMSGMDDLAVQSGANMLLTFKNIKNGAGDANKIFDQSTRILADMTVALGSDPQKQAIQLGKALNDPVKGISALARVGVTFTEQQKKNIAAMVEHGNVAGAQKIILRELKSEFGDSAKAAGETMGGQLNILKAHLEDTEQVIGEKILPVLNKLIQWAITNWPTFQKYADIAMKAIEKAWVQYGEPALVAIRGAITGIVEWTRTNWDTISGIYRAAFRLIQGIVNIFTGIFKGDWDTFWKGIKQVVSGVFDEIVGLVKLFGPFLVQALQTLGQRAVDALGKGLAALPGALKDGLKALPGLALAAAILVGRAIVAGVKWAVPHIIGLAGDLIGKIGDAIHQVAGWALGAAEEIGRAIAEGVVRGTVGLPGRLLGALMGGVSGALAKTKAGIGAHSPSTLFADELGLPIAQGVIQGWLMGSASLPEKMAQGLQNAIERGRTVIQGAQASFQAGWSQIASDAGRAFSAIKGAKRTPAEKELAGLQSGHEEAARQKALADAQAAVAAGGDPAQILAAQQQLADAQYAIQVAALQRKAEAERVEQDARVELQQRHFDEALAKLQTNLAKGHTTYEEAHKAILKLFKGFGINYSDAGAALGKAFVTGLKESIQNAAKKSGELSGKLEDVARGIHVPHAATGGFVSQTGLAVIHAGETISPAGAGGSGGVTVIVNGWVGNDQAIAEKVRNELIRLGRNTTGGALGRFA